LLTALQEALLHEHGLRRVANARLDERCQFPDGFHAQPGRAQDGAVVRPRRDQRGLGIVEQVDVAGSAGTGDDLVERATSRDVALTEPLAMLR
jgi:hypothetical protein